MNPSTELLHDFRSPLDGHHYLSLIVRRTYRILPGRRVELARDQTPLELEREYESSTNPGALDRLARESDLLAPLRPFTDVVLRGSAWATAGSVTSLDTHVEIGDRRKSVRVIGDREISMGAKGTVFFSAPEPFRSMPLTWDHAYGGCDTHAEAKLLPPRRRRWSAEPPDGMDGAQPERLRGRLSYPRNGSGRGYFFDLDRERLDRQSLPNLEDPEDPVTPDRILTTGSLDWMDRPSAACYDVIDILTFPRAAFLLPPDSDPPARPIREVATGHLTIDEARPEPNPTFPKGPRVYNAAPAGLAHMRLQGRERVRLTGLHPKQHSVELELPGVRPRLFIEPPNVARRELQTSLASVIIEAEEDRVSLIWCGALRVAAPYPDDQKANVRHEAIFS